MASMPLEGIRVLDWGIWFTAPGAAMMLGSLGAEVIKIEDRKGGDPNRGVQRSWGVSCRLPGEHCLQHEVYNRNKMSISVDWTKPEGQEIIYRLVEKSDVFLQNFRQGIAQRMNMDYKSVSQRNPQIIYANISAYGTKGPDSGQGAFDMAAMARTGVMLQSGAPGSPPQHVGRAFGDMITSINVAYGVLAAIVARERQGIGQEIEVSLLGSILRLQEFAIPFTAVAGEELPRVGHENAHNPLYNWYRCSDDKWLVTAHYQSDHWWPEFCRALGIENLQHDPRFNGMANRDKNHEELISILDKVFAAKTREEWIRIFKEKGLLFAPVNGVNDLFDDPQVKANNYITEFDHEVVGKLKFASNAVEFSKTPMISARSRAPEWGEHTEKVLTEIAGYTWEDIDGLRSKGVI